MEEFSPSPGSQHDEMVLKNSLTNWKAKTERWDLFFSEELLHLLRPCVCGVWREVYPVQFHPNPNPTPTFQTLVCVMLSCARPAAL